MNITDPDALLAGLFHAYNEQLTAIDAHNAAATGEDTPGALVDGLAD